MPTPPAIEPNTDQPLRIPVLEETLYLGKQVVETEQVRISKDVETYEQTVVMPLSREQYDIEHVAIGQLVDVAPAPVRYEGDMMIISVLQEEVVVQKRLRLVEEIRLTKRQTTTDVSQPVTLRRETVRVERLAPDQDGPAGDTTAF